MKTDLSRMLSPKSIAVIGGGFWGNNIIEQCLKFGFDGEIFPVHPKAKTIGGLPAYASLSDLPSVPDVAYVAVNREATIDVVGQLRQMGVGGAVCFASGFLESAAETGDGADLQAQLLNAAGQMPILGPNCYGYINALDQTVLWPDQHGCVAVQSGVAIITQSSNIAINMTMQQRGLPIATVVTAGNQAQLGLADIGMSLLADPRITALGLHIEGVGDVRALERLAQTAFEMGKRIVAIKIGASDQAQKATVSHTASLSGSDAGAKALLDRLGIIQVSGVASFLEALKILHFAGPLKSNALASLSCSGGEASLIADIALNYDVVFPQLTERQTSALSIALGPKVALANPLDYHTYIWGNTQDMAKAYAALADGSFGLTVIVVDFPRADRCRDADWECVIEAAQIAQAQGRNPIALLTSLPENMSEQVSQRVVEAGLLPLHGIEDALAAISAIARAETPNATPVFLQSALKEAELVYEDTAKAMLKRFGVDVPTTASVSSAKEAAHAADEIGYPVVLKGLGLAHKSDSGAVHLHLETPQEVTQAAMTIGGNAFLVEEMITNAVAELLVGIVQDPVHGMVLTLGAGGIFTEILRDSTSMILPVSSQDVRSMLSLLKLYPLLTGYRGRPKANIEAIVSAVMALQDAVIKVQIPIEELEINPLICGQDRAIAVDALVRQERKVDD